jgi:hypothetical protein
MIRFLHAGGAPEHLKALAEKKGRELESPIETFYFRISPNQKHN